MEGQKTFIRLPKVPLLYSTEFEQSEDCKECFEQSKSLGIPVESVSGNCEECSEENAEYYSETKDITIDIKFIRQYNKYSEDESYTEVILVSGEPLLAYMTEEEFTKKLTDAGVKIID